MTGKQKGFWRAANWAEPTAKKWERKWGCEERERVRVRLYRMADTSMRLAKSNESYLVDGSGVGDADGSSGDCVGLLVGERVSFFFHNQ